MDNRCAMGAQIISSCDQRQPLKTTLRRKLVRISCHALMKKTNSDYPSTDQRQQLSECIVDQLFMYMSPLDKTELKVITYFVYFFTNEFHFRIFIHFEFYYNQILQLSYFTPSTTYSDTNGRRISKTCMGYISSFFRNFWQSKKSDKKATCAMDSIPEDNFSGALADPYFKCNSSFKLIQHSRTIY